MRVVLRQWRDVDREPFAALNADPVVMEPPFVGLVGLNEPSLRIGFEEIGLDVVMERIGMTHDPSRDFEHPSVDVPELKRHVLYAVRR